MASLEISARRMVLAAGFAVAVAATPVLVALSAPSVAAPSVADCPNGESTDTFTGVCTPDLVPNSPEFGTTAPAGGLPEINGIPCTGANSGQCIGLSEDAPQYVPPTSSVGSSPTVHGVS
ncbi:MULTISPECIES: intersectin-EH binding protein Ibp1 [unclassified Mycolicibacterium]|uniref:intersectin-EH binding protein Ibp1 n=1 Tax=unclassified Mycolicibacterium TaxID=2636767 RepID=UPI001F4C3A9E|nr:intersectin-EH binding protein Ibp1 [Mycolicibacterium sp. YH-1]UNB53525.1 intersectin-EH binding protein Ibp1 [Mycolicibacterium sp. YH-1]